MGFSPKINRHTTWFSTIVLGRQSPSSHGSTVQDPLTCEVKHNSTGIQRSSQNGNPTTSELSRAPWTKQVLANFKVKVVSKVFKAHLGEVIRLASNRSSN